METFLGGIASAGGAALQTGIYTAFGSWKLPILIAVAVYLIGWRVAVANVLVIRRNDKAYWIVFALCEILNGVSWFIQWPEVWAGVTATAVAGPTIWALLINKKRAVLDTIQSANVIYDTHDERVDKSKEQKIHCGITFAKRDMMMWVPVFGKTYRFKMSSTAKNEEFLSLVGQIGRYFDEYDWQGVRKGEMYIITGSVITGKAPKVPFDTAVSDALPWYMIPLGVVDPSNKTSQRRTVYIWQVNEDHKMKTRKDLSDAYFDTSGAPHGMVVGSSGGGKSVLINTILAHLIRKNTVELTLIDPKKVEFGPYENLKEVKRLAKNLDDAVDVFRGFRDEMQARYTMMDKLFVKKIPLDGMVDIGSAALISGNVFTERETVQLELPGGKIVKEPATSIMKHAGENIKVFIEADKSREDAEDRWLDVDWDRTQVGGEVRFPPLVAVCDEYAELVDNKPRSEYRKVEEIQNIIESIARLGRAADIHVLLASQSSSSNLFPTTLRNNIKFRNICGRVDSSISNMAIGTDEGENIPRVKGAQLGNVDGQSQIYRGYLTETKDILSWSSGVKEDPAEGESESADDKLPDWEDPEDYELPESSPVMEETGGSRFDANMKPFSTLDDYPFESVGMERPEPGNDPFGLLDAETEHSHISEDDPFGLHASVSASSEAPKVSLKLKPKTGGKLKLGSKAASASDSESSFPDIV